jgi:hypothetical protein
MICVEFLDWHSIFQAVDSARNVFFDCFNCGCLTSFPVVTYCRDFRLRSLKTETIELRHDFAVVLTCCLAVFEQLRNDRLQLFLEKSNKSGINHFRESPPKFRTEIRLRRMNQLSYEIHQNIAKGIGE